MLLEYEITGGRKVIVEFSKHPNGTKVIETFEIEKENLLKNFESEKNSLIKNFEEEKNSLKKNLNLESFNKITQITARNRLNKAPPFIRNVFIFG